jgi:hypothetical protein
VDGHGFFRRWGLILPAALAPAIEALVLGLFGPVGAIPLAPQVSAPTPLGLFHDLRWISVYHNGWVTLALEILGVLILRSLWVAWVVQRSWPDDEPPPMGRSALRSVVFLVVTAFLLIPFVVLLFGLALTRRSSPSRCRSTAARPARRWAGGGAGARPGPGSRGSRRASSG